MLNHKIGTGILITIIGALGAAGTSIWGPMPGAIGVTYSDSGNTNLPGGLTRTYTVPASAVGTLWWGLDTVGNVSSGPVSSNMSYSGYDAASASYVWTSTVNFLYFNGNPNSVDTRLLLAVTGASATTKAAAGITVTGGSLSDPVFQVSGVNFQVTMSFQVNSAGTWKALVPGLPNGVSFNTRINSAFWGTDKAFAPEAVPEQSTYTMLGSGILGLGWWARRKRIAHR